MSDRYRCCGARKSWSRPAHTEDCPMRRPKDECPAHPGQDRYDCAPCESLSEERRERARIGD